MERVLTVHDYDKLMNIIELAQMNTLYLISSIDYNLKVR